MQNTFYKIKSSAFSKNIRFALVSDLHAQDYRKALELTQKAKPDYILLGGDIFEAITGLICDENRSTLQFLVELARLAPCFYCTGNHEDNATHSELKGLRAFRGLWHSYNADFVEEIKSSGVRFLIDDYVILDGIAFGGLASGLVTDNGEPNLEFLQSFAALDAPKVLISHHPEYYPKYIKSLPIDLIVSGHAHGGQWRFFNRGVFAPGQGLFPKYTAGVYDGRLVVSRGLKAKSTVPRIFNPCEVVIIDIEVEK